MKYELCKECGQPMLRKGQKRKDENEYRHARGCSLDDYKANKDIMNKAGKRGKAG
jgi:hypothetical protein